MNAATAPSASPSTTSDKTIAELEGELAVIEAELTEQRRIVGLLQDRQQRISQVMPRALLDETLRGELAAAVKAADESLASMERIAPLAKARDDAALSVRIAKATAKSKLIADARADFDKEFGKYKDTSGALLERYMRCRSLAQKHSAIVGGSDLFPDFHSKLNLPAVNTIDMNMSNWATGEAADAQHSAEAQRAARLADNGPFSMNRRF